VPGPNDQTQFVNTIFRVQGDADKKMAGLAATAASLQSAALKAVAAVGGLAAVKRGVIGLNAAFEETTLTLAGMVRAYKLEDNFGRATVAAEKMLKRMQELAAPLPGEAEDYITALRTSISKVIEAGKTGYEEIATFVSKYTAVAIANQVDAAQAGRDLMLMLSGRAGVANKTWGVLVGHIKMGATEFNRLSAPERMRRIETAISKYDDLTKAYANTWSAQIGAFMTYGKEIIRLGTKPLFEKAKNALAEINTWLEKNRGWLIDMVQAASAIGPALVKGFLVFKGVKYLAGGAVGNAVGGAVAEKMLSNTGGAQAKQWGKWRRQGLINAGTAVAGNIGAGGGGDFARSSPGLRNFAWGMTKMAGAGAAALLIAKMFENVHRNVGGIGTAFSVVAQRFNDMFEKLGMSASLFGDQGPIGKFFTTIAQGFLNVVLKISTAVQKLAQFGETLGEYIFQLVSNPRTASWSDAAEKVEREYRTRAHQRFLKVNDEATSEVYKALGDKSGTKAGTYWQKELSKIGTGTGSVRDLMSAESEVEKLKEKYLGTYLKKAPDQRSQVVMDFRGSRFDIKQQFAEGFDPDRIVVAFANDLAVIGEHRLQSGLSSAWSVR
jgi:hypothetical protein